MKLLTKEEEDAHYSVVVRSGAVGGAIGLAGGLVGVWALSRRYPGARVMTLPFRAFLVSSATTTGAVIFGERASIDFGRARDPMSQYRDSSQQVLAQAREAESSARRALEWARDNRYRIVVTSWVGAITLAMVIVGRDRYLTMSQKVVQARVYAQGLTIAVLLATALLELGEAKAARKSGWQTVMVVDPEDPEHKRLVEKRVHREEYEGQDLWKDMVEAEERRLAQQKKEKLEEEEARTHAHAHAE